MALLQQSKAQTQTRILVPRVFCKQLAKHSFRILKVALAQSAFGARARLLLATRVHWSNKGQTNHKGREKLCGQSASPVCHLARLLDPSAFMAFASWGVTTSLSPVAAT